MRATICSLVALVLLVVAPRLFAQSGSADEVPKVDRSYKLLRENEDWSFLKDPALKEDFWDSIKYVRLRRGTDDWYLTFGGEVREVWEQVGNDNWGQQP